MDPLFRDLLASLDEHTPRIERCLAKLTYRQIWTRPLGRVNSIGNICLHLAGNENHYVGACIGKNGYERDRPGEFNADDGPDADALTRGLREARARTTDILARLTAADHERPVESNHPPDATVTSLLIHVATHYAYHTGQVISLTKQLLSDDGRLLPWDH